MSNIKLKIKTIDSLVTEVIINTEEKILSLKERLEKTLKISSIRQRMIFQGRILTDTSKISECKLQDGHVIHLIEQEVNNSDNTNTRNTETSTRLNNYENFFNMLMGSNSGLNQFSTLNSNVGLNYISSILNRENNVYDIPESFRSLETNGSFNKTEMIEVLKQNINNVKTIIKNVSILNADNSNSLKGLFYNKNDYKIGQWVDVKDTLNQWLEAQIINIRGNECQVHYNGWGNTWNEWVPMDSDRIALFRTQTLQMPYSKYYSPFPNNLANNNLTLTNIHNFDNFDTFDDLITFIDYLRDKLTRIIIEKESLQSLKMKIRRGQCINNEEENLKVREKIILFLIGQIGPLLDRVGRLLSDYANYTFRYTFETFRENFNQYKENIVSRVYNSTNESLLNSQVESFKNLTKVKQILIKLLDSSYEEPR
jgi:hypothetical protein